MKKAWAKYRCLLQFVEVSIKFSKKFLRGKRDGKKIKKERKNSK
jgi:hypothetical protein